MPRFNVEQSPRYRLAALARMWLNATEKAYERDFGLSLAEWRILAIVGAEQPINAAAIVDRGMLEKSHISRLVSRLTARGLMVSQTDARDGRKAWLSLTPAGEALFDQTARISIDRDRTFLEPLDPAEREALDRLLTKLTDWSHTALKDG